MQATVEWFPDAPEREDMWAFTEPITAFRTLEPVVFVRVAPDHSRE